MNIPIPGLHLASPYPVFGPLYLGFVALLRLLGKGTQGHRERADLCFHRGLPRSLVRELKRTFIVRYRSYPVEKLKPQPVALIRAVLAGESYLLIAQTLGVEEKVVAARVAQVAFKIRGWLSRK